MALGELTAVKDDLPHGHFLPWIAAEFEMSRQTADNFESVYARFGKDKVLNFSIFKPSVLYALAAPSTPETVIDKAVAKAESGEKVTVADVKEQARYPGFPGTASVLSSPLSSPGRRVHNAVVGVSVRWSIPISRTAWILAQRYDAQSHWPSLPASNVVNLNSRSE